MAEGSKGLLVRPDITGFFQSLDNTQKAFIARVLLEFPDVWPALEHEAAEWWNSLDKVTERIPLVDELHNRFYESKEVEIGPETEAGNNGENSGG